MAGWTDDELRRTAEAYLAMLGDARSGRPYSKAEVRRALIASHLAARSEQAIKFRMRNISAVLDELGRPTLPGYVRPRMSVAAFRRAFGIFWRPSSFHHRSLPA